MTELPSKQPDDQRSEAECQLGYQMANLEVEVARLRAANRRLEQALSAAGRVLEPYYVKRWVA
jgi:hypothetical protein